MDQIPFYHLNVHVRRGTAEFIERMLREIRKKIKPFGDLLDADRTYEARRIISFLSNTSHHIEQPQHEDVTSLLDRGSRIKVSDVASSEGVRAILDEFIRILDDCIQLAKDPSKQISLLICFDVGLPPSKTSKKEINDGVNQWVDLYNNWSGYIELFDGIYPRIFHSDRDILSVLSFMVQKYPKIFWEEYWSWMSEPPFREDENVFAAFLNDTVVPQLMASDPNRQMIYCKDVLKTILDDKQRPQKHNKRDDFADFLEQDQIKNALISTGIEILPRFASLSAEFQTEATRNRYRILEPSNNVILY